MDITNFDDTFAPRRPYDGPHVRDFLFRLRLWVLSAIAQPRSKPRHTQRLHVQRPSRRRNHHQGRPAARLATLDDHLLRDIGHSRLGMRVDAFANHNEAS